ncbi:hypothetical protein DFH09DRAFT_1164867 [Mycena vulgaris]|nr:hypothetical protein DFH09DRAFT_1164867 [Mycena vulgaris]
MFGPFKLIAAVMLLGSVAVAIDIQAPEAPASGGPTVIRWTPDDSLDVFSVELFHPDFNDALAIANSVNPDTGMVEINLPSVPPADGYTIEFVNPTDINEVYGTSPAFSIAAPVSTSESSTASASATMSMGNVTATMSMSGSMTTSMHMSSMSASASAKSSAASATASNAALPGRVHDAGTAVTCAAAVLLGLLSAAWVL